MAEQGDDELVRLIYTSFAAEDFGPDDLVDILERSRSANSARRITGLLLFRDERFLQMLEGPRAAVEGLITSIFDDLRHIDVYQLLEEPIAARSFPHWSMGFQGASDASEPWPTESIETFHDITAADPSDENKRAIGELLERFRTRVGAEFALA